jgi:uncharacterized protein
MIKISDINSLALGASFLSSGGGGDSLVEASLIKELIEKNGELNLINISSLSNNDLIMPTAFIGSIVGKEKLLNKRAFNSLLYAFKKYYGKLPAVIMPGEIGGANGLFPLIMGAITGIPILDGDLLGRSFPEVHMASTNVIGSVSCAPTFLVNDKGAIEILFIKSPKKMEKAARAMAVKWGGCAIIGVYCMNALQGKSCIIKGSISKAIQLGHIMNYKENDVLTKLCEVTKGRIIFTGKIKAVERRVENGFLKGKVEVLNKNNQTYTIHYKNEYLAVCYDGNIIFKTPDIISILNKSSFIPISSEKLIKDIEVTVISCASNPIWYTEKGLKLVGIASQNMNL